METDTIKLLKECDSGTKTAINSIKEVLDNIKSPELLSILTRSTKTHQELQMKIGEMLVEKGGETKDPNPMARMMSWMKINFKLMEKPDDKTVAGLMLDGCGMGIKQLCGYINEYKEADAQAIHLAEMLVREEENLIDELKAFL